MKKVITSILLFIFLISFISAIGMTASAVEHACTDTDDGKDYSMKGTVKSGSETNTDECAYCTGLCEDESNCESSCGAVLEFFCEDDEIKNETHICEDNEVCKEGKCMQKENQNQGDDSQIQNKNKLTDDQIQKIIQNKNRIRINNQAGECPEKCACTGSVTKCQLEDGTREMTIQAGKSGNVIFQVKGINASTKVELYKSEEKIYGMFKNNKTKEIKILPDELKERIRERIKTRLENQLIELDEDGIYQVQAKKRARLFAIFPIRATIRAEINSETGEITRIKNPWWNFMAKDIEETEE